MQQSVQEIYPDQTDEIDLGAFFNLLVARKFFIFGFTGFVTLLAIIVSLNITPTYKVISSFTSPSDSSLTAINKLDFVNESKQSVFANFLTTLSFVELQKKSLLKVAM